MQIRVLLLPYFHTEPIRLALEEICGEERVKLHIDRAKPSQIAELDLSHYDLVQVPALLVEKLRSDYTLSQIVIAARGPIMSVAIFHTRNVDICALDSMYATSESVVSKTLLLALLNQLCGSCPRVITVDVGLCNLEHIVCTRPTLLIGDFALVAATRFRVILDLGELWARLVHKPLVFAVLMYRRVDVVEKLIEKLAEKLGRKDKLADYVDASEHWVKQLVPTNLLLNYVLNNVTYLLDVQEVEESLRTLTQLLSRTQSH